MLSKTNLGFLFGKKSYNLRHIFHFYTPNNSLNIHYSFDSKFRFLMRNFEQIIS
jgi:hypothetical protein